MTPLLYIAGPMSDLPESNFPAFDRAAERLRKAGYEVLSPAEDAAGHESDTWEQHMRRDLAAMCWNADSVATIEGFEQSTGASLEVHVAKALTMEVMPVSAWLQRAATT